MKNTIIGSIGILIVLTTLVCYDLSFPRLITEPRKYTIKFDNPEQISSVMLMAAMPTSFSTKDFNNMEKYKTQKKGIRTGVNEFEFTINTKKYSYLTPFKSDMSKEYFLILFIIMKQGDYEEGRFSQFTTERGKFHYITKAMKVDDK